MLNIKGEKNNMKKITKEEMKNEIEQRELRSQLWSLVHEVSKLDMELARKLDIVNSDLQELQFRIGLNKGTDLGLEVSDTGRSILALRKLEEDS